EIDGLAGLVVAVGPEVAVGVERLHRRLVAEAVLHGGDRASMGDEQRGVEVPQVVERGAGREAGGPSGSVPDLAEGAAPKRPAEGVGEDEALRAVAERGEVLR